MSTIIVGVDGSSGGRHALRAAVAEAKARNASLRVVTAWHVPGYVYGGLGFTPLADIDEGFRTQANDTLESALRDVRELAEGVEVEGVACEGRPASVLVDQADGAELLVVGSRGLGGFAGLLLGSVSQECVLHSPCSILVVRDQHASEQG